MDKPKYRIEICPECWHEQEVDIDDDVFICEACEYQYFEGEGMTDDE